MDALCWLSNLRCGGGRNDEQMPCRYNYKLSPYLQLQDKLHGEEKTPIEVTLIFLLFSDGLSRTQTLELKATGRLSEKAPPSEKTLPYHLVAGTWQTLCR